VAVSLVVQNQNHVVLRRVTAEMKDLGGFAMKLPGDEGLLLRGIHPYGDTYFNMVQLKFLVDEIDRLAARYPDRAAMLNVIAAAAQEAIAARGYLMFIGD
jgi:D-alanyl-lipoteichoic acid acyltransferase DltB (MBOAT superfamily)